jgi:hypothetical protein
MHNESFPHAIASTLTHNNLLFARSYSPRLGIPSLAPKLNTYIYIYNT